MTEAAEPTPTALYRLFDAHDRLLYVGTSHQPEKRFKEHAHGKAWWHHVMRREIHWFDSQPEALRAESAAVQTEGPAYDATHRLGRGALDFPPVRYDATAEIEALTDLLRQLLQAGELVGSDRWFPLRIAERFTCSRVIAVAALDILAREGVLSRRKSGYSASQ